MSLMNHVKFNVLSGAPRRCNTTPAVHSGRMATIESYDRSSEAADSKSHRQRLCSGYSQALTDIGLAAPRAMGANGPDY